MSSLFKLPPRATKAGDSLLTKKIQSTKKEITIKGGKGLLERISMISTMVNKNLGKYKDRYIIIDEEEELKKYIQNCIENKIVAIDTETTGLDPMQNEIVGICLYTPNNKGVYIPLNHVSYITGLKVENQLSKEFVKNEIQKLKDNDVKVIMFNAKFDIRVLKNHLDVELKAYWDGYIAARLLNENEEENNLKSLHRKYCLNGEGDAFNFDSLFKEIPFSHIPIKSAYLYAARDPEITFELYKFQEPYLMKDNPICIEKDLQGVSNIFHNIEIPLINIVAEMEDTGIEIDFEYTEKLSKEYTEKLKVIEDKFYKQCESIEDKIYKYRQKMGGDNKLPEPINIGSPIQISILLYDVLEIPVIDKKNSRGTGEEILLKIDHVIAKTVLEYREVSKLLSTYINKMPLAANSQTGRIHASFNQMGADTGRFSSSEPNLQNIPSHNKDIRKMFKATDGYYLLSSDYSAQEPRLTAHMSKDEKMIKAYKDGKDLYAEMASLAFNVPYEECKEFRPDGTLNPKGKERREHAKAIFLGICYGKGVKAIGEDLKLNTKKAQQIYDSVLKQFTGLKQFMMDSENMAKEKGFVTTLWGRKRRLPNMQLEQYEFEYVGGVSKNFDPLVFDNFEEVSNEVDSETKQKYINILNRTYNWKRKQTIITKAKEEGIIIKDNGGFIAEATRQCVNSRIQGSAADQTKIAMILVGTDKQLKNLGFRLLLTVHDELIGECPKENVKEVSERFANLMIDAAKNLIVPSKCDVEITNCWYGDKLEIGDSK